jgi:hypothetical protein
MNNKLIGILILVLYFLGFHICDYFYPNGGVDFIKLRVSIYCIIILLALKYKDDNTFVSKLFNAIVINNIYVLLFKSEYTYSINDLYFIIIFTSIQYVQFRRGYFERFYRTLASYFLPEKKKQKEK